MDDGAIRSESHYHFWCANNGLMISRYYIIVCCDLLHQAKRAGRKTILRCSGCCVCIAVFCSHYSEANLQPVIKNCLHKFAATIRAQRVGSVGKTWLIERRQQPPARKFVPISRKHIVGVLCVNCELYQARYCWQEGKLTHINCKPPSHYSATIGEITRTEGDYLCAVVITLMSDEKCGKRMGARRWTNYEVPNVSWVWLSCYKINGDVRSGRVVMFLGR